MKKTILIVVAFVLTSAFVAKEKEFTIKFSESEINKHWQKLSTIKQLVSESNLPHQQVVFVEKTIDSLQMVIASQVQAQLDTTKKK